MLNYLLRSAIAFLLLYLLIPDALWELILRIRATPSGSGDRMFDWYHLAAISILCFPVAAIWTLIERNRISRATLSEILTSLARYFLGVMLISYGLAKVIPAQFPPASAELLMRTYADSSPMGLLWTFMSFSPGYNFLAGLAELIPGLLLLFRPTYLLGAMIVLPVLFNVAALNFLYGVPVKQLSVILFLLALGLTLPHAIKLLRFLTGKSTDTLTLQAPLLSPKWQPYWLAAKILFLSYNIITDGYISWTNHQQLLQARALSPLGGIYWTDAPNAPFRKLAISPQANNRAMIRVEYANTTTERIPSKIGPQNNTLDIGSYRVDFTLTQSTLILKDATASYTFHKLPPESIRLTSTPFRWVQDLPYNR
jgi:hypothetical protein